MFDGAEQVTNDLSLPVNHFRARGIAQALIVAELTGRYLEGGVDMATFWPLRLTGKGSKFRSLLDRDTNEPRAPYHVLKLFGPFLQMVRLQHNPAKGKEGEFSYELEKDVGMVKLTATLNGTTVSAEWDGGTDIVTIEPRGALNLSWADFLLFLSLTRLLVKKAKEF